MDTLDPQERAIVRALIRHPRRSDNSVSADTGVPVRTVRRKRKQLEASGRLRYYTALDTRDPSAATQHMIIIKFRLGITRAQVEEEIRSEPNVANVFAELIRDSYMAELDGHVSLVMVLEGESDSHVIDSLQGKIIPSLKKNHGEDSILELRTMRVLSAIRRERNYLPTVNMDGAYLREGWPDEAIFVGEGESTTTDNATETTH
ncbi:MAG: Lrp/AsnC family transcriptional regulator [Gemmatimonadetes bacterium]|jgi:DNA-binding Lrp family transcriptional regulator|nr:Lrp/AsnC family transcriptional regulator [Gemmatimonadota bacterium]MBT7863477.1 Lrp/AsnC family transcriptional regulator [Gemmatimonadota bacterium]